MVYVKDFCKIKLLKGKASLLIAKTRDSILGFFLPSELAEPASLVF
jgi:hypothetical protein